MSQVITLESGAASGPTSQVAVTHFRRLRAAPLLLAACGLVAITMLDGSDEVTAAPPLAAAPAALPFSAPTGQTSVPDASTVFAGREVEVEEPAPTF